MHIEDEGASRTADGGVLIKAWLGWRGEAMVPSRADMNLADISRILPRVTIVEAQAPEALIFRLAGTHTYEVTGIDLTGMNYIEMAAPELREHRARRMWPHVAQPCASRSLYAFETGSGLPTLNEIFALPPRQEREDAPMQIISVTGLVDVAQMPEVRWHGVSLSPLQKLADDFEYIDIGAGVPPLA